MSFMDEVLDATVLKRKKEAERQRILDASGEAAKSGGLSAALIGGAQSLLSGRKPWLKVGMDAALAGLGGAALSGGATYLGSEILGAPQEGEGGFTNRAALGGALAGGAVGAGLGGLLGGGKLKWLSKIPGMAEKLAAEGPLNNLVTDQIKKVAKTGSGRTAAALGLGGAALGGGIAGNEGMAVDYMNSLDDPEIAAMEARRRGVY